MTDTSAAAITGTQLLALRTKLKWGRRQMTQALGEPWTEGRLNGYEHEKRGLRPREHEALVRWVQAQDQAWIQSVLREQPAQETSALTTLVNQAEPQDTVLELFHEPDPYVDAPLASAPLDRDTILQHYAAVLARIQHEANGQYAIAWPIQRAFTDWDELTDAEFALLEDWCANVEAWLTLLHEPGQVLEQQSVVAPAVMEAPAPTSLTGAAALRTESGLRMLTNGEIQTFKHCRRRWWLSWHRGLRLKTQPQVGPAPLGTRVHEALAGWYVPVGETPVDPRETLEKRIQLDEMTLLRSTAEQDSSIVAETLKQFSSEADMARAMVEGYVEWLAETGADAEFHVIAPEVVLQAVMELSEDLTILLQGKLDVRVQRDHDLVRLFLDHKTVGDFKTPARILPMDEQMKHYHVLEEAQDSFDGTRTDGAIYNMLRKVKRTASATPPFYERLPIMHNAHTIETFRERLKGEALTIDHTERMLGEGVAHQVIAYPSPSRDCTWKCEFTALCTMLDDGSRAEDFITEHYDTVNPLDRYVDEKGATS